MRSDIILHSTGSQSQVDKIYHQQAENDNQLIDLWINGRSKHTQRAYLKDVNSFLKTVAKPLHQILLVDLQGYASDLMNSDLKTATVHRALSAIKSLFAFAHRLGYLPFDTARPLRLPKLRNHLAERILDETDVKMMIALEPNPRNKAILLTFYASGIRVSELSSLKWRDLIAREKGGQITVVGKGGKTRSILLPQKAWDQLISIKHTATEDQPVFKSRNGKHLDSSMVWRIVRRAAIRAGIDKNVSCHWLRHSNASHALDNGAPVHLIQQTLGHSSIATTGRYLHSRPTESSGDYLDL